MDIIDIAEEQDNVLLQNQIKEVQEKAKLKTFDDLINSLEQWDM